MMEMWIFIFSIPKDPIIRAYSRIYPGLFKDAEDMPKELQPHVRYPQDIFDIQMAIYKKYHQTDPEVFYQYEDLWEFAKTYKGREDIRNKTLLSHARPDPAEQVRFSAASADEPRADGITCGR